MKIIKYLLFSLIIGWPVYLTAQEEPEKTFDLVPLPVDTTAEDLPDLYLISKSGNEGLMIRWAPTNVETWQSGIDHGYVLERILLGSDTTLINRQFEQVTNHSIKPWPLDDWQKIVGDKTPYTAIAAMAIHGEEQEMVSGFVGQAQAQENRHGYNLLAADLDRIAALASGLMYIDPGKDAQSNFGLYRIFTIDPLTKVSSDTAYLYAGYQDPVPLDPPIIKDSTEYENAIAINWYNQVDGNRFTAYHIERSMDGINFERITDQPFINAQTNLVDNPEFITYIDSLEENYQPYYYRVFGLDAFGDISPPSQVIKAMGRDRTPTLPPTNLTVTEPRAGVLAINWDWEDSEQMDDLAGFKVYKSIDVNEAFVPIAEALLTKDSRSYLDSSPDARATNYYYVVAFDQEGNKAISSIAYGFTKDEFPPAAPSGLSAEVDSSGLVLLQWVAPTDQDIRGYQVFYSNSQNLTFAAKPGNYLQETYYVDSVSLHTLTKNIYYYVIAIDYSYNQSKPSEILEVKRPDIIPPSPSVFKDYQVDENEINLSWLPSISEDVAAIRLLRREAGREWEILSEDGQIRSDFRDTIITEGKLYEYSLLTIDDSGNQTFSEKSLFLEALNSFFIPEVTNFNVADHEEGILLTWDYPNPQDYSFVIYRGTETSPIRTIRIVRGETTFLDNQAIRKTEYVYAIKVRGKDGRESILIK